ncbi:hypothetical protein WN944_016973 [Citrus x changshan-huyou]|uniref:Uncharacterized protein n=1 Tax=Citrus x changshan-huyou TaxID=2935761 RepID=A0AAP0MAD1_9ROSI
MKSTVDGWAVRKRSERGDAHVREGNKVHRRYRCKSSKHRQPAGRDRVKTKDIVRNTELELLPAARAKAR